MTNSSRVSRLKGGRVAGDPSPGKRMSQRTACLLHHVTSQGRDAWLGAADETLGRPLDCCEILSRVKRIPILSWLKCPLERMFNNSPYHMQSLFTGCPEPWVHPAAPHPHPNLSSHFCHLLHMSPPSCQALQATSVPLVTL